ncbi:MAG: hypothetical protein ABSG58_08360, partial [Acidimicrobiales bacterium]
MVDTDGSSVATSPVRGRVNSRSAKADLVVVANRLPVRHVSVDGTDAWQPSPGGLVSALTAV